MVQKPMPTPVPQPTEPAQPNPVSTVSSVEAILRIGGIACAGMLLVLTISGIAVARARNAARRRQRQSLQTSADQGCIEVYDAERGEDGIIRVPLQNRAVGELIYLGSGKDCDVLLDTGKATSDTEVMAVLKLTPAGPLIESRAHQLTFEGQPVLQHLLFDGDVLHLDRFVLYYHNFFRPRPSLAEAFIA